MLTRKRRTAKPNDWEMLSLHRYFLWTGFMRFMYHERSKQGPNDPRSLALHAEPHLLTEPYLPYWYAGMHVLVEGWRRLGLASPDIDPLLLDSDRLRLLETFRHAVYHFHPEYYDVKFTALWEQGVQVHAWLNELWLAFDTFFKDWGRHAFPIQWPRDDQPESGAAR